MPPNPFWSFLAYFSTFAYPQFILLSPMSGIALLYWTIFTLSYTQLLFPPSQRKVSTYSFNCYLIFSSTLKSKLLVTFVLVVFISSSFLNSLQWNFHPPWSHKTCSHLVHPWPLYGWDFPVHPQPRDCRCTWHISSCFPWRSPFLFFFFLSAHCFVSFANSVSSSVFLILECLFFSFQ